MADTGFSFLDELEAKPKKKPEKTVKKVEPTGFSFLDEGEEEVPEVGDVGEEGEALSAFGITSMFEEEEKEEPYLSPEEFKYQQEVKKKDPTWGAEPAQMGHDVSELFTVEMLEDAKDEVRKKNSKKLQALRKKGLKGQALYQERARLSKELEQDILNIEQSARAVHPELYPEGVTEVAKGVKKRTDSGEIIEEKPVESDLLQDPIFSALTSAGIGFGLAKNIGLTGKALTKEVAKDVVGDITMGLTDLGRLGVQGAKSIKKKFSKSKLKAVEQREQALKEAKLNDQQYGTNDAEELQKAFARFDEDDILQSKFFKRKAKDIYEGAAIQLWDNKRNVKNSLETVAKKAEMKIAEGELPQKELEELSIISKSARSAVERRVLQHGASEKSMETMKAIDDDIFKGLKDWEIKQLEKMRESLRSGEIAGREVAKIPQTELHKEAAKYKSAGKFWESNMPFLSGKSREEAYEIWKQAKDVKKIQVRGEKGEHLAYSKYMKDDKLDVANEKVQKVYNGQLKKLVDEGIISQKAMDDMLAKGEHYDPRRLLHRLDPAVPGVRKQKKGVNSNMPYLETGSGKQLYKDLRYTMQEYVGRTDSMIYRNRAAKALHKYAEADPNSSIIRIAKKGESPMSGEESVKVMIDGQETKMFMPEQLAKEWNGLDPILTEGQAKWASILSGNKVLKAFATGLNPAFALRNLFRDAAYIYMSPQYSGFLPKAALQMASDYKQTFKDAVKNKGLAKEYIEHGGGLGRETLTRSGRVFEEKFKKTQDVLGKLGEISERWTRLAHMNRAIKNGNSRESSAFIARDALDFAQGGQVSKMVNNVLPYFNAGIQGTRGMAKLAAKDPKKFGWKLANLGGVSLMLYGWNTAGSHKEDYDKLSPHLKATTWSVWTPFTYTDEEGEEQRYFLHIPKDHTQQAFTAIFDNVWQEGMGHEVETEQSSLALQNFLDIAPTGAGVYPPLWRAVSGYKNNLDSYREQQIWKGDEVLAQEEWTERTPEIYKKVGQASAKLFGAGEEAPGKPKAEGLSPNKLRYAVQQFFSSSNIVTNMLGLGVDKILKEQNETDRKRWNDEMVRTLGLGLAKRTYIDFSKLKDVEQARKETQTEELKRRRKQKKLRTEEGEVYLGEEEDFGKVYQRMAKKFKRDVKTERILETTTKKDIDIWRTIAYGSKSAESAAAQVYRAFGDKPNFRTKIKPLIGKLNKAYPNKFGRNFWAYLYNLEQGEEE